MDDTTFVLAYGIFSAAVFGILLFLLLRGTDRKRYLRPVVYGVIFGGLCSILFISGIVAFLLGGALTGYLLAREVGGTWNHFRAGALDAVLLESSFVIANTVRFITLSVSWFLTTLSQGLGRPVGYEEFLYNSFAITIYDVFFVIAIVGVGAVLGGMLRKLLKPTEQKSIGSGVGQGIRKTWSPQSMECPPDA